MTKTQTEAAAPAPAAAAKRVPAKKAAAKKAKANNAEKELAARVEAAVDAKRKRTQRPFPAAPFEEAIEFAKAVLTFGSGQPVRRLSLFDHLGKSPESGPSRQLVVNGNKYGLIEGGYQAEHLKLTEDGLRATDDDTPRRERTKAQIKLAIQDIPPFAKLFDRFSGNKLPARAALTDAVVEFDVPKEMADEAIDTFIVNLRFLGLLQTLSGAERIVSIDHLLDSLPATKAPSTQPAAKPASTAPAHGGHLITKDHAQFESTCFYVTPIGEEGSEERKHSDLFLGSFVEPALEQFHLTVVRADAIDKPGTITRQIIEYLLRARLVIVDLSYHNPNVFYELALRHAVRLPVVQIIRQGDRVPFDVNQVRTIRIDTTDIFTLVPKIDTYRSEIASQVRRALEDPDSVDNPITTFYPSLRMQVDAS